VGARSICGCGIEKLKEGHKALYDIVVKKIGKSELLVWRH
jgi:hypothetical protein